MDWSKYNPICGQVPSHHQLCLVYRHFPRQLPRMFIAQYDSEFDQFIGEDGNKVPFVSHWISIPENPSLGW